jgi:YD repeat-containing protein
MKKTLLLTIITFSLITLWSCEEDNLINGATGNTNTTTPIIPAVTTKCYLKEQALTEDGENYSSKYSYNTKNQLININNDGAISTYEYDGNNRVTKLTVVDGEGIETLIYDYDSKGYLANIKYSSKNTPITMFIDEYKITTNSSGQITQVKAITEDMNIDFLLEYDSKSNLKKLIASADGQNLTLIENRTFDDKTNAFANAGLGKIHLPFVLVGAFFGENLSYFLNTNNILTDTGISFFSEDPTSRTYKYEYSKDGLPSKMSFIRTERTDKYEGSSTFTYDCK